MSRLTGRASPVVPDNDGNKQWFKRLLKCSLQDLIVIYVPYMVVLAAVLILACYVYDPTLRLLLYSALPECHQTWLAFVICYMEEMRFMLMLFGIVTPVWQLQVLSLDLINKYLELIIVGTTPIRYTDYYLHVNY